LRSGIRNEILKVILKLGSRVRGCRTIQPKKNHPDLSWVSQIINRKIGLYIPVRPNNGVGKKIP